MTYLLRNRFAKYKAKPALKQNRSSKDSTKGITQCKSAKKTSKVGTGQRLDTEAVPEINDRNKIDKVICQV